MVLPIWGQCMRFGIASHARYDLEWSYLLLDTSTYSFTKDPVLQLAQAPPSRRGPLPTGLLLMPTKPIKPQAQHLSARRPRCRRPRNSP